MARLFHRFEALTGENFWLQRPGFENGISRVRRPQYRLDERDPADGPVDGLDVDIDAARSSGEGDMRQVGASVALDPDLPESFPKPGLESEQCCGDVLRRCPKHPGTLPESRRVNHEIELTYPWWSNRANRGKFTGAHLTEKCERDMQIARWRRATACCLDAGSGGPDQCAARLIVRPDRKEDTPLHLSRCSVFHDNACAPLIRPRKAISTVERRTASRSPSS